MIFRFFQKRSHALLIALSAVLLLSGCTSRYRLTLVMTVEEQNGKVKIDQSEYLPDTDLGDPYADDKLVNGSGSVLITTTGTRMIRSRQAGNSIIGFDEYLVCRLYLQLPQPPQAETIDLAGNSFLQMMGRFERPLETKIFLPIEGQYVIDSVTSRHLFVTINGRFENKDKAPIILDGRFKAKFSR